MSDITPQTIEEVPTRSRKGLMIFLAIVVAGGAIGVVWWFGQGSAFKTYSEYGISFDYPARAQVLERGIPFGDPDEDSGIMFCSWYEGGMDYIYAVIWVKTLEYDIDTGFDGGFSAFEANGDFTNVVRGARGETPFKEFTVLHHQTFECDMIATGPPEHGYGVIAVSYFGSLEKVFIFMYVCESDDSLLGLQELLTTFEAK